MTTLEQQKSDLERVKKLCTGLFACGADFVCRDKIALRIRDIEEEMDCGGRIDQI